MMPYLFLQLATMLNIAKWAYYFQLIKTHRSIREVEIEAEIYNEQVEPSFKDERL